MGVYNGLCLAGVFFCLLGFGLLLGAFMFWSLSVCLTSVGLATYCGFDLLVCLGLVPGFWTCFEFEFPL